MDLQKIMQKILERGKNRSKKPRDGLHKHRIIPGFEGGKYVEDNVTYLTRQEHRIVHKIRYKLFNNKADKISYTWLSGALSDEIVESLKREGAKLGGKISGNYIVKNKIGLFSDYKPWHKKAKPRKYSALPKLFDEPKPIGEWWKNEEWASVVRSRISEAQKKLRKEIPHPQLSSSFCIGCHERVQISRLKRAHRNCFHDFSKKLANL